MDEPTRRAWSSPELIVLGRSGPEEAVLGVCKEGYVQGGGPVGDWSNCIMKQSAQRVICAGCHADTKS